MASLARSLTLAVLQEAQGTPLLTNGKDGAAISRVALDVMKFSALERGVLADLGDTKTRPTERLSDFLGEAIDVTPTAPKEK